jgi:FHA domain/Domain of unknown function (DUF1707)
MGPSEDTREAALAHLREGYVSGRMGSDTFAMRVDEALSAPTHAELRGLTADIPAPAPAPGPLDRLRAALARRRAPRPVLLPPPGEIEHARLLLGRSRACTIVLADDTVSRSHAELVLDDGRWTIRDLGSSNGTWVNGRRVVEAEVRPGDEVVLGDCRFRL